MGIEIRSKSEIPKMVAFLRELSQNAVEAGLFANLVSEKTMIAATASEFGAVIRMTPKMRGWFWAQMAKYGLRERARPVGAGGLQGFIVIPARPFVQGGLKRQEQNIAEAADRVTERGLRGQMPARDAMTAVGLVMERAIKDEINRIADPALHPLTAAMKGSTKPLVGSGTMRAAITCRVVRR